MELNLPNGPWKTIASAKWNDHPISIYSNPKRELLMIVFDKTSGKKGVLLLMKKVFSIESGELDRFLESQTHELTFITRASEGSKKRFLLVDVDATYVTYNQAELVKAVKQQHMELEAITKITIDMARGSGVQLAKLSKEDAEAFLGDPFTIFSLNQQPAIGSQQAQNLMQQVRVLMGLQKNGSIADASLSSLAGMVVMGESEEKQLRVLQVACENALLNGVPCLIFDSSDAFGGLALPNENASEYERFRMPARPTGFPFKSYPAGEVVNADLSAIQPETLIEVLAVPKSDEILKNSWKNVKTVEELVNEVEKNADAQSEKSQYFAFKTVRALKALHKQLGGAFGENELAELRSPWAGGTGKVVNIDCTRVPPQLRELVQQTVLKQLKEPMRSQLSLLVVFDQPAAELSENVKKTIAQLSGKGIGFAVRAENESDLKPLIPLLKIDLIGNEAISSEGDDKKRFLLRPAFSQAKAKATVPNAIK